MTYIRQNSRYPGGRGTGRSHVVVRVLWSM